jgi:hypothetical protein
MINTLIAIGIPLGYVLLGALLARTQAVRIFRWRWDRNVREYNETAAKLYAPTEARVALTFMAVFWPFGLVALFVVGLSSFVIAPVNNRKERAEQLRKGADYWAAEARSGDDPEKRRMARELAKSLREQAEELKI